MTNPLNKYKGQIVQSLIENNEQEMSLKPIQAPQQAQPIQPTQDVGIVPFDVPQAQKQPVSPVQPIKQQPIAPVTAVQPLDYDFTQGMNTPLPVQPIQPIQQQQFTQPGDYTQKDVAPTNEMTQDEASYILERGLNTVGQWINLVPQIGGMIGLASTDTKRKTESLNMLADQLERSGRSREEVLKIRQEARKATKVGAGLDKFWSDVITYEIVADSSAEIEKKYEGKVDAGTKILADVSSAALDMLPQTAIAYFSGGTYAMAYVFASSAARSTKEGLQLGATPDEAQTYGILNGAIEVGTEILSGGWAGVPKGKFTGLARQGLLGGLEEITLKIAKSDLGKKAISMAYQYLGEGAEEYLAEVLGNWAKGVIDPNMVKPWDQVQKDAAYAGLVGALTSVVMDVGRVGGVKIAERSALKQMEEFNSMSFEEQVGYATAMLAKTDTDLVFADEFEGQEVKGAGMMVTKDGKNTVVLPTRLQDGSENILTLSLVHEFTHTLEQKGIYNEFKSSVLKDLKKIGLLDALRQQKQALYDSQGVQLTAEEIDQEIVATFVQDNLFKRVVMVDGKPQTYTDPLAFRRFLKQMPKRQFNLFKNIARGFLDSHYSGELNESIEQLNKEYNAAVKANDLDLAEQLGAELSDLLQASNLVNPSYTKALELAFDQLVQDVEPAQQKRLAETTFKQDVIDKATPISQVDPKTTKYQLVDAEGDKLTPNSKMLNGTIDDAKAIGLDGKELVALHNISSSNLIRVLKLGGFPMPSIAVTKAEIGHEDFGEISVVFNPNVLEGSPTYWRDAYTPRFPEMTYGFPTESDADRFIAALYDKYESIKKILSEDTRYYLKQAIDVYKQSYKNAQFEDFEYQFENLSTNVMGSLLYYESVGIDKTRKLTQEQLESVDDNDRESAFRAFAETFGGREYIFNKNVEYLTRNGNRRTFNQRTLPVTAENIVKAMMSDNIVGAVSSSLFGEAPLVYSQISPYLVPVMMNKADVKAKSDLLGRMSNNDASLMIRHIDRMLSSLEQSVFNTFNLDWRQAKDLWFAYIEKYGSKPSSKTMTTFFANNNFLKVDLNKVKVSKTIVEEILIPQYLDEQDGFQQINSINKYGENYKVTYVPAKPSFNAKGDPKIKRVDINIEKLLDKKTFADIAVDVLKHSTSLLSDMFESKPKRVVTFNEIDTIVLPKTHTQNQELMDLIKQNNINYQLYDLPTDRTEIVKSLSSAKFMLLPDEQTQPRVSVDIEQVKSLPEMKKAIKSFPTYIEPTPTGFTLSATRMEPENATESIRGGTYYRLTDISKLPADQVKDGSRSLAKKISVSNPLVNFQRAGGATFGLAGNVTVRNKAIIETLFGQDGYADLKGVFDGILNSIENQNYTNQSLEDAYRKVLSKYGTFNETQIENIIDKTMNQDVKGFGTSFVKDNDTKAAWNTMSILDAIIFDKAKADGYDSILLFGMYNDRRVPEEIRNDIAQTTDEKKLSKLKKELEQSEKGWFRPDEVVVLSNQTKFMLEDELSQTSVVVDGERVQTNANLLERIKQDNERIGITGNNLVALHNIDDKNLGQVLDLGALPMPSIAVTKDEIGHTRFGNVSLLINPSLLDQSDTYAGDAWTTTFPHAWLLPKDAKSIDGLETDLFEIDHKKISADVYEDFYRWMILLGSTIRRMRRGEGVEMSSFIEAAQEDGMAIKMLYDKDGRILYNNQQVKRYLKQFSIQDRIQHMKLLLEKNGFVQRISDIKSGWLAKPTMDNTKELTLENVMAFMMPKEGDYFSKGKNIMIYNATKTALSPTMRSIKDIKEKSNLIGLPDRKGFHFEDNMDGMMLLITNEKMSDYYKLDNILLDYVRTKRDNIDEQSLIDFAKDRGFDLSHQWTDEEKIRNYGRRMFDLVLIYNKRLENLLARYSADLEEDQHDRMIGFRVENNEVVYKVNVGEEYNVKKYGLGNFVDKIVEFRIPLSKILAEAGNSPANFFMRQFKTLQSQMTYYFESKPKMAVPFTYVDLAVVPTNLPQDVKDKLTDNGIPYEEYTTDEERKAIVSSQNRSKFMLQDDGENKGILLDEEILADGKTETEIREFLADQGFTDEAIETEIEQLKLERDQEMATEEPTTPPAQEPANEIKKPTSMVIDPKLVADPQKAKVDQIKFIEPDGQLLSSPGSHELVARQLGYVFPIKDMDKVSTLGSDKPIILKMVEDGFVLIANREIVITKMPNAKQLATIRSLMNNKGFGTSITFRLSGNFNQGNDVVWVLPRSQSTMDYIQQQLETLYQTKIGEQPNQETVDAQKTKVEPIPDDATIAQRKHPVTAANSGVLDEAQVNIVQRDLEQGKFDYVVLADKPAIERANKSIGSDPDAAFNEIKVLFDSGRRFKKDDMVKAEVLIQAYAASKQTKKAMELLAMVAEIGTELGQSVQAMSVIKKMGAAGRLMAMDRVLKRLSKQYDNLELKISDELRNELLSKTDTKEMEDVVDKIKGDIAKQLPANFMDKLNAWRYLSMLGNPKTHIRNYLGNAIFWGVNKAKDSVGAALESVFVEQGKRTKALVIDKKIKAYAKELFEEHQDEITSSGKYDINRDIESKKAIFKNKALEKARQLNFDWLEKEDDIYLRAGFIQALGQYMTSQGLTKETLTGKALDKAILVASEQAKKRTFRQTSNLATTLNNLEKDSKIGRFIVGSTIPFKKTPINILKAGYEFSPLGLLVNGVSGINDVKNEKITPTEYIDRISAGLTGTGIALLGAWLYSMGLLTAGEDDEEGKRKTALERSLGFQRYSLRLGDWSVSLDWIAPAVMPLMIGAEMAAELNRKYDESILNIAPKALANIFNPAFELTMLQGVVEAMNTFEDGGASAIGDMFSTMAANYVTQFFPTVGGQMARTIDPTQRSTYSGSDFEGFLETTGRKILNKIPGGTYLNEPVVNIKGEEVKQPGDIWLRGIQQFLNPANIKENITDDTDREILRLFNKTGETSVIPPTAPSTFTYNNETIELGDGKTNYAKTLGSVSYNLLSEAFNHKDYDDLPDDIKAKVASDVYEYAVNSAKAKLLMDKGITYVNTTYTKILEAENAGIKVSDYLIMKNRFDTIKATGDFSRKENILAELVYGGYTNDEIYNYLVYVAGYSYLSSDQKYIDILRGVR